MKKIILNRVKVSYPNYHKYVALVDDRDFERVEQYNWNVNKNGNTMYATTKINGKPTLMHKFLTGYKQTDHIDGNGLNNQRSNLREATTQQNAMNKHSRKGTSKYKGVSKHQLTDTWQVYIRLYGKNISLGHYKSEAEAAQAYNLAAQKYYGKYARLNQIA